MSAKQPTKSSYLLLVVPVLGATILLLQYKPPLHKPAETPFGQIVSLTSYRNPAPNPPAPGKRPQLSKLQITLLVGYASREYSHLLNGEVLGLYAQESLGRSRESAFYHIEPTPNLMDGAPGDTATGYSMTLPRQGDFYMTIVAVLAKPGAVKTCRLTYSTETPTIAAINGVASGNDFSGGAGTGLFMLPPGRNRTFTVTINQIFPCRSWRLVTESENRTTLTKKFTLTDMRFFDSAGKLIPMQPE